MKNITVVDNMKIIRTINAKNIVILATLLLIATSTLLSSASAIPTVGANVNVTTNTSNQNEPMVAINPTDHNKLVCGFNDERTGVFKAGWSWSDDGGTTWTFGGTFSLPGYSRGADPVVAFDNTGTAYFAGLAYNYQSAYPYVADGSIFLAKSSDGGHTFTVAGFPKIVAAGSGTSNYLDKPWLFVNPANNHIYLAWVKRVNVFGAGGTESMTIWFTRSTDGGVTFDPPQQISTFSPATGTDRSHGPQITAVSGSHVYVSWHTLEAAVSPNPPTFPWRIWIAESTDGGVTFGTNYLVATTVWGYPNRFISMDADPSTGRIYITYADSLVASPRDYDVFVTTSTSAAGPWTSTKVSDDPAAGNWQFWPSLDVAPNGRVDVIWYDQRDDPVSSKDGVYYTASTDGGATWETNTKVTDLPSGFSWPNVFFGDYLTIASVNDKAQAVWADNRLGNPEIYTATLTMPVVGPQPPIASFTESAHTALVGTTINFDASGSSDPDGTIVLYEWDFDGDGTYDEAGPAQPNMYASHVYSSPGTFTVTLRVTDDDGLTDTATDTKTITSVPTGPTIESSDSGGAKKDTFDIPEDVYVVGSGYIVDVGPHSHDLYVVEDVATWTDGMAIPSRVAGTATTVSSDGSGNIPATLVWSGPLVPGKYDIVVDVNGNGLYDANVDALDDSDVQVTAGFFVVPEVPLGTVMASVAMIIALAGYAVPKFRKKQTTIKP